MRNTASYSDPHGDLASSVLVAIPRRRRNDLVWFDATETAACRGGIQAPCSAVPLAVYCWQAR